MKTEFLHLCACIVVLTAAWLAIHPAEPAAREARPHSSATRHATSHSSPTACSRQADEAFAGEIDSTAMASAFPEVVVLTEDEANALPAPNDGDRSATDLPPGESIAAAGDNRTSIAP